MASLERNLRKDLETTVKKARRVAESGARKAVVQLGVGEAEAPKHLTAEQRVLRNQLRAHGRQLGDRRDARTGVQDTTHLVQECAYEHWHRMLFARFLAETNLLIEPGSGVAVTLDEVQELAREKKKDWLELASDYAERMLPQIFRKGDPVLDIALPPETRSEMEDLLKGLTRAVFEADDSLGWVYQFWQTDKKEEVDEAAKSGLKVGADELPAVTQLFTEDYMVLFLLHNTLGAWWAGKVLADTPTLATSAPDEATLRAACRVGGINWTYLRFVRETAEDGIEGSWRPAAGVFEGWPKAAKDLTVLDPCMGSGHFLVFALPVLVAFRMAEEGLSQTAAFDAVLRDNIFGLEIDPRCTQIAAFNLAFAAWRKIGYRALPQLNLACSGLAIGVTKAEWLKLAEKAVTAVDPAAKRDLLGVEKNLMTVGLEERVKNGLEALYDLFAKAPWLGSLIDPRRAGADIFRAGFDKMEPLLASIFASADTDDAREMAVAAQGMAKAAELLARTYVVVVTNVPYLGRAKQHDLIQTYCDRNFPTATPDLATCFVDRCLNFTREAGTFALVSPQNWTFLGTYRRFREHILKECVLQVVANLGPAAFQEMNWWAATTLLSVGSKTSPVASSGYAAFDTSTSKLIDRKIEILCENPPISLNQFRQLKNPDSRLLFVEMSSGKLLEEYAEGLQGISTTDLNRFVRSFWEIPSVGKEWVFMQGSFPETKEFSGKEQILRLQELEENVEELGAAIRGRKAWSRKAVFVRHMRHIPATLGVGSAFDANVACILPSKDEFLPAIWAFCSSEQYHTQLRKIDQKTQITNATLVKVPFDLAHWRGVSEELYPEGLPTPSSNDPTQWLFAGSPNGAESVLLVAVSRLLDFRWPRQRSTSFIDCSMIESDGLEPHSDVDGIVCLTALKGEPPAEQRVNSLLADAFGADWSAAKLASLLSDAGYAGKSLDDWLRDGFFAQHTELFEQRPFIWHIWDGRRDGFHALVNYHRLAAPNGEGRRTLEKLIYSYLGDWIDRQRADQKAGVEGADARLAHAEHLKAELVRILEGEAHQNGPSYDIFVRWKPLHEQPIGWDPDINDGVRINIRPFMTARTLNARGANACILRATPKIKWDKDRGKEPGRDGADYPWFWGWDEAVQDFGGGKDFDGNRWNDLHYSHAVKQAARDRHAGKSGAKR